MAFPKVTGFTVKDIRFPTSLEAHGSDAMHTDPDYSCAYVIIHTEDLKLSGHGLTFTCGNGTNIVVAAINGLLRVVKHLDWSLQQIFGEFGDFWRKITSDSQMRWLGPEKGVMHLATGALINAYWDLWAKIEGKPLWQLLADMSPEKLVSTIDWRYMSDMLTKEEAIEMLKERQSLKERRIEDLKTKGYPVYITSAGWLGYSDDKIRELCQGALSKGFTRFKVKVGKSVSEDLRRCKIIREEIGDDRLLMTDCNQVWEVQEAVEWMKQLAEVKPLWIEEPTSPDDILGHAYIAEQLKPYGIGVATGEMCQNRVMFKQFLKAGGMQFCQIDSCRLGGVNENIAVMLMAEKLNIPVCPHAGGVGLCEMVMHLSMFYYCSITKSMDNRFTEFADHLHEHFVDPVVVKDGHYQLPTVPGYSTEMTEKALKNWEYPCGHEWQKLFAAGTFKPEY
ncbi:mitochondrial enolase superfamily member 1-like [Watersipora subatra]|uniref:mitochondrial enolase superfamily member 1-like n=1 Tax=Watersipora subatra TaxID=2589382 RepID=UPI00355AE6C9